MENKPSADTARSNSSHEEKPVVELSEFLPEHREATLYVRSLSGDAHHKFPVFLFDASCCGSSAYWSITGLLASLGMITYLSDSHRRSRAWRRAGLQYELGVLDTPTKGDTTGTKHKTGCTETVMLLLTRWSFCDMLHNLSLIHI